MYKSISNELGIGILVIEPPLDAMRGCTTFLVDQLHILYGGMMDLERFVDSWLLVCLGIGTLVVGTERGWRFYRECSCPVTGSVIVGSWASA